MSDESATVAQTDTAPVDDPSTPQDEAAEWEARQNELKNQQGLTADNAVPEQRPIASQRVDADVSPLTQRLIDEGEIPDERNAEPMPKEAYDAANSDSNKKKAAKAAIKPAAHVGTVIQILDGPHRDRKCSVLRVISYASSEDLLKRMAGNSTSDYAQPEEVEVSFRGDGRDGERAVLNLQETDYEIVTGGYAGRGAIAGSV